MHGMIFLYTESLREDKPDDSARKHFEEMIRRLAEEQYAHI